MIFDKGIKIKINNNKLLNISFDKNKVINYHFINLYHRGDETDPKIVPLYNGYFMAFWKYTFSNYSSIQTAFFENNGKRILEPERNKFVYFTNGYPLNFNSTIEARNSFSEGCIAIPGTNNKTFSHGINYNQEKFNYKCESLKPYDDNIQFNNLNLLLVLMISILAIFLFMKNLRRNILFLIEFLS